MAMVEERFACLPPLSETRTLLSLTPPPDFLSLRRLLLLRRPAGAADALPSLRASILAFDNFMRHTSAASCPRFDFFHDLLPHIHAWALASPSPVDLPILRAGFSSQATLSRGTIRTLLSNAFFLNVFPFPGASRASASASAPTGRRTVGRPWLKPQDRAPCLGNISFMGLYNSACELAVQRLLCLLAYFECARHFQAQELEEAVCFERHATPESELPNWENLNLKIDASNVYVHTENMECSDAKGIMDFANKALHIHKIIPSATQEEVLFSTCPEAFPGILFCDILTNAEVIIIRNVRRLVQSTGYASTFKFDGLYPELHVHDIIVADATNTMHFTKRMNDRDLNKAYLGFQAVRSSRSSLLPPSLKISTSHWGCGAFRGDKHHKFLQQVCASALAGVQIDYSTFGDRQIAASFRELLHLISSRHHTIASVYRAMSGYSKEMGTFSDYVYRRLSKP